MNTKHLELLGFKAKDKITGFTGIISTVSYDLYGCVQMVLTPETNKEGKISDAHWFDEKRLVILSRKPIMAQPSFRNIPGPAEKPSFSSLPT